MSVEPIEVTGRTCVEFAALLRRRGLAIGPEQTTAFYGALHLLGQVGLRELYWAVPFDRSKLEAGIASAAKGRPLDAGQIAQLAVEIEDELRLRGPDVTSEQVGLAVLERLRDLDKVAYMRFASVYKGFDDPSDFERELVLLTKDSEPKRH